MNCPYCAEDIKEEAIYCKHCSHDLTAFVPLYSKIKNLERTVAELESTISEFHALPLSTEGSLPTWRRVAPYFLAACCLAVWGLLAYLEQDGSSSVDEDIQGFASIASLLFFGFLSGVVRPHLRPRVNILLAMSWAFPAVILINWSDIDDHEALLLMWPVLGAVYYFAIQCGMAITNALQRKPARFSKNLAQRILGSGKTPHELNQIQALASAISAIAPILTLIGTLGAAYLAYLGSLAKK